ncbi:MAG: amidohydrolase [Bacteroidetes bacterium]|nr:MAG: amidohydrolase [Bacteroidota bacterium]REK06622.1 MAG: amidohydrolase [Bacteroidota bacterium]REK33388.1 MAG: amidohydrolase [Bacteroidota bacterium]REK49787.1 MAG: amidohydrolase [Bacteroidota bacterium]
MKISLIKLFILITIVVGMLACGGKKNVDLILYNGIVYTVDNAFSVAEAIAIRKGQIYRVGKTEDILEEFTSSQMIDLEGKAVYPGFIDAHCHFYGYATDLMKCNLTGTNSFEEALQRMIEFEKTNDFSWLLARGWDQNDWTEKEFPTKEMLDSLFPEKPVFALRIDGHAVLCNSKALEIAGITSSTKIFGGEILMKDGALTGLLLDNAVDIVKNKIPAFSREEIDNSLIRAEQNCFEHGITTVTDAGLGKDSIEHIYSLQKDGRLKMRVYAMVSDNDEARKYFLKRGPLKAERLTVRALKMYADGALGSRGACLKKDYADQPGHRGFLLHTLANMEEIADEALENGFQLCTHAIGDSAAETVLKLYSRHLSTENNKRWRLEHCQVMSPKDMKMLGSYGIIPSVQPTHATSDMYWAEKRLGPVKIKHAYAYKDIMIAAENMIALGTDFPVEDISPIMTFYAATQRKDLAGFPEKGFLKENALKRKDALRGMTIWAAYANFEEDEKGSIEEGKFADLVVLDRDILDISGDEIPATKVMFTIVAGEVVFSRLMPSQLNQ